MKFMILLIYSQLDKGIASLSMKDPTEKDKHQVLMTKVGMTSFLSIVEELAFDNWATQ